MLRILSKTAIRSAKFTPQNAFTPLASRSFFWKNDNDLDIKDKIPADKEFQTGRRKIELDAAEKGYEAFANSSIVPPADAGSWEKPILVSDNKLFFVWYISIINYLSQV